MGSSFFEGLPSEEEDPIDKVSDEESRNRNSFKESPNRQPNNGHGSESASEDIEGIQIWDAVGDKGRDVGI